MLSQKMIDGLQSEIEALRSQIKVVDTEADKLREAAKEAEKKYYDKLGELDNIQKAILNMKRVLQVEGVNIEDLENELCSD